MNLGELFFTLGVKTLGLDKAKDFEQTIDDTAETMAKTTDATEDLSKASDTLNQKFDDMITNNKWVKAGFVAAQAALVAYTNKMGNLALSLDKASFATGVGSKELQILGHQMKQVGGNAETLYGTLSTISDSITNIELGKGDLSPWAFMGIDPQGKDPIEVLDEVKKRLSTMPQNQARVFAKGIGIDDDTLFMLQKMGNLKPIPEGTLVPADELKALEEFSLYTNGVMSQWSRILQRLGAKLVPFVKHTVYALDRVSSMIGTIFNMIKPLEPLIEKVFLGMALMAGVVAAKMFPVTAMIIGLGLALEDLWTFMQGGDSLIGRVIEQFSSWENILKLIINSLGTIGTMIDSVFGSDIGGFFADQLMKVNSPDRKNQIKEIQEKNQKTSGMSGFGIGSIQNIINVNGANQNPKEIAKEVDNRIRKSNTNAALQTSAVGY